ncbi:MULTISPECIES: pyridoxal phosphate-dependent aminotransferase [Phyllobacteriaceae]|jgi:aspartate aminotransferase|uniref:aspartate transaminase n=1 Tax=Mesorhizobium hungaricum TaxID=1566387 RepID=A0A1C2EA48_9HYPH|nr:MULTISPECIES: pyridoxal phosphate-dependent aminotransferase [Mesorhizobium]MBN9237179.1 pyridoxal phosphate-dependent aminotransferase [Mesorhizobium sp.]MDQ0329383.1 aspartate/methionine/tyrosine aminotransferase [Mesorhizobium sp. YL-MeA3-2017]OCX23864.1 aspartate aminotransferase [Mesorhizobium hungaricum]
MIHTIPAFDRLGEENAFAVLARATALAGQGRDIVNLGIGQPDFRTPEHIVEAAIKALRDGHHGYTPATGLAATREAVVRRTLATTGVEVSPDNVMILPGGKPTMFAAILMFGEAGADILYPDPGFPIYRSMIEFTGARPVPVPIREENGFAFSADETLALITPTTRLLILNSPANPTGGVTPRTEIEKLVKGLERHPHVAILSDEIYDVMTYDGERHCSLLTFPEIRDRLIVLNGWSKTWAMTGWRMGWSIWPNGDKGAHLYDKVRKLAVNCWSCVNAPSQYAGIAAIDGPQDEVAAMMRAFDRRRKLVVEGLNALPGISCITPKGAFYAFPNISGTGWKAKKLASALLEEAGVALIGGPDFGVLGEGYMRLSYANSEDNIARALQRIGDFLIANAKTGGTP